jgi:hypothetical protein
VEVKLQAFLTCDKDEGVSSPLRSVSLQTPQKQLAVPAK